MYLLLGFIMGLEPLSSHDDFWLYDTPINPVNQAAFLIMEKLDMKPQDYMDHIVSNLKSHRCKVKLVKIFGKYFFQDQTDEEYE